MFFQGEQMVSTAAVHLPSLLSTNAGCVRRLKQEALSLQKGLGGLYMFLCFIRIVSTYQFFFVMPTVLV